MNKSKVPQKQFDKENIVPATVKGKASPKERNFYLIVEIDRQKGESTAQGVSQYWFISSRNIVEPAVVSNETVYTGKKLKINNNEGRVVSGTCVLFSPDQHFVEDQFAQITFSGGMENQMSPPPAVLGVSTKGNVLTNGGGTNTAAATTTTTSSGRKVKVPSSITVKSIVNGKGIANGVGGQENEPLGVEVHYVTAAGRPMMYDQQSQTDPKMYDGVVPATAAQSHQQAQQIAQLIRANNGLVMEVKNLRQMMVDMDSKLVKALDILSHGPQPTGVDYVVKEEEEVNLSSAKTSVIEYALMNDSSMDQSISFLDVNTSRDKSMASSVKSENTPPLKKNKQKLRNSLQEALTNMVNQRPVKQELLDDVEYVEIGANGTKIPKLVMDSLNFSNYSAVTRKVLIAVFDRETLATHSLTGKPSPAFLSRDAKMQLDPAKTEDIVKFVSQSCNVNESLTRSVITSKLADENKMMRLGKKRHSLDTTAAVVYSPLPVGKKRKAMDKENYQGIME